MLLIRKEIKTRAVMKSARKNDKIDSPIFSHDPVPSTSSSSASTLTFFSKSCTRNSNITQSNQSPEGNFRRHLKKYNNSTKKPCSMETVGRTCVNTIRRSRQNVAIATQVLNPSAIGGSLKAQRVTRHFGPPDDDTEGFITFRRRMMWKKMGLYGLIVLGTILILMAIIIAIGYVQSEKHKRITSRSVKLIQTKKSDSFVYTSTVVPLSVEPTESKEFLPTAQSSFLFSSKEVTTELPVSKSNEETAGETLADEESNEETDYSGSYNEEDGHGSGQEDAKNNFGEAEINGKPLIFVNGHRTYNDDKQSEGENEEENNSELDRFRNTFDSSIIADVSLQNSHVQSDNRNWKSSFVNSEHSNRDFENDGFDTKVKVKSPLQDLPPVFSLEIPIYQPNKTISDNSNNHGEDELRKDSKQSTITHDKDDLNDDNPTQVVSDTDEWLYTNESSYKPDDTERNNTNGSLKPFSANDAQLKRNKDDEKSNDDKFHKAILHTALFHADVLTAKPEDTEASSDNLTHKNETRKSVLHNTRGRHRKVKVWRSGRVVKGNVSHPHRNGKSLKQFHSFSNPLFPSETEADKTSEENQSGRGPGRSRGNVRKKGTAHLRGSPSTTQQANSFEESPRLLSSSAFLPNMEAFFRAILQSPDPKNPKLHESNLQYQTDRQITFPHQDNVHKGASDFGANFVASLNQYIPSSEVTRGTPPTLDSSQFSRYPAIGSIGHPTSAGAALSNLHLPFTPSITTHDSSVSGTSEAPRLTPGVIPLDLTASFIPVGGLQTSQLGSSSLQNPSRLNFPLETFPSYAFSNSGSDIKPVDHFGAANIGTLTTTSGGPPTYNTISQGLHLLNMISGVIPKTYFHDQIYPSNQLIQNSVPPLQLDALKHTSQFQNLLPFNTNPEALNTFDSVATATPQLVFEPSHPSLNSYDFNQDRPNTDHLHATLAPIALPQEGLHESDEGDIEATEDFLPEDTDQVPAASSLSPISFSQSILKTFEKSKNKKFEKSMKQEMTSSITAGGSVTLKTKPNKWATPPSINNVKKTQSQPQSFTFEILPGKGKGALKNPKTSGNIIEDTLSSLNAEIIHSPIDSFVSESKSKKKDSVSLHVPKSTFRSFIEADREHYKVDTSASASTASGTVLKLDKDKSFSPFESGRSGPDQSWKGIDLNKMRRIPKAYQSNTGPKSGYYTV